ncbi:MAG: heat shock protein HspQ [Hyphomonas sp.]|nr:heat shock protein HspQ [Hyphomonas sp.]
MARRVSLLGWLQRSIGLGRRKVAEDPLLLDRPLDRDQRYNDITPLLAKFQIGQVVRHRHFPFRGIIFDVDPVFANTDEWYDSIPEEVRPRKDQPFYHLFAENERTHYVAYVSEQNHIIDDSDTPLSHPDIQEWFNETGRGRYELKKGVAN